MNCARGYTRSNARAIRTAVPGRELGIGSRPDRTDRQTMRRRSYGNSFSLANAILLPIVNSDTFER